MPLVYGCSTDSDEMKQEYSGTVVRVIKVNSAPQAEQIKSVTVRLDSGEQVSVFIKENESLKSGDLVRVFRYSDHPSVYYLLR